MKQSLITGFVLFISCFGWSQVQFPDTNYQPPILEAEYPLDSGPVVFIDEGHHNFHRADGRYRPFADLLRRDGYRVKPYRNTFNTDSLAGVDILVISNALNESNMGRWFKPIHSAFSEAEIDVVVEWVQDGGRLFLIADHMPFAGAAADLAARFGYTFYDGFAGDTTDRGSVLFARSRGAVGDNRITNGRNKNERVDSIVTFTGQAFEIPEAATSILNLGENWVSYQCDTAWVFNEETEVIAAKGMSQGAYQEFGSGRTVVFGEAAMFSAQIARVNDREFSAGMNHPDAKYNYQLLLNIMHWLDDL